MTATTVWEGLRERFVDLMGEKRVILGEPSAIHDPPVLITVFDRTERKAEGREPSNSTVTIIKYFFAHRIAVQWVDNPVAEAAIIVYANSVPAAINADPSLGGRVDNTRISDGVTDWATYGGTKYRVLDFTSESLEKVARSANI